MRNKAAVAARDEVIRPISMLNQAIAQHTGRPCQTKTRKLLELGTDGVIPIVRLYNGRYGFYPSMVPEIARRLPTNTVFQIEDPQSVGAEASAQASDRKATSKARVRGVDSEGLRNSRSAAEATA